jgi:hypothetical protein
MYSSIPNSWYPVGAADPIVGNWTLIRDLANTSIGSFGPLIFDTGSNSSGASNVTLNSNILDVFNDALPYPSIEEYWRSILNGT